jgi:hypothetical protein
MTVIVTTCPNQLAITALRASRGPLQQNMRWAMSWSVPYAPTPPHVLAMTAVQIV